MRTAASSIEMKRSLAAFALFCAYFLLTCSAVSWGSDYAAPLPYTVMYDQLTIGMSRQQAYEITRAPELQREPADLEATDLLRLESVNRRCLAQLLRLHWHKGQLHWIEYFRLNGEGVTYQERGNPDPIGEGVARQLIDTARLYASHWDELTAAIAQEGSPALQVKAKQVTDSLRRQLEAHREERPQ